jgi:RimJ/RimL family protein N-acetyltransferase
MPQASLTTTRLELVPLGNEHLEDEIALDSDPEVLRFLWGRARTRAEVEVDHRNRLKRADRVDGLGLWAGLLRGPGAEPDSSFVGLWMLMPPHGPDQAFVEGEADLGYRLMRRWWRRGLGVEGARALLAHGFEGLGLTRVFAQTMATNAPSRALLSSLGMTYVGHVGQDGADVEYEMRATAWPP